MVMHLTRRPCALTLALALLAFSCADEGSGQVADSTGDIASPGDIIGGDAGPDAGSDAAPDTGSDAAPDTGSDAADTALDGTTDADGDQADADSGALPATCCDSDADCTGSGGGPCVLGQCAAPLIGDACYTDADCEVGSACHGAVVKQCESEQGFVNAGQCLPDVGPCCETTDDCPDGDVCVGPSGDNSGVCKQLPPEGRCWSKAGCGEGEACLGGFVCPCNADCIGLDTLGHCAPEGAGCCTTDAHCGEGEECAELESGLGVCMQAAGPGACWSSADCPTGVPCVGASFCPCGAICGVISAPGTCQGGPVDCCTTDFDCAAGERCVGDGSGVGVCKPVPGWGQCWDSNDCSPTQTCTGGSVCPCDADCDQPDTVGACTGGDSGCCTGAGVCPDGHQCMPLSGIGWSTCVAKPEPGRCWSDTDCPEGHACEGQALCPCNLDCDMAYEGTGVCTPPGDACTPIESTWVLEWCDAASVVIWNGSSCEATCPGCCECQPFCDKTFQSMEECQSACLPPTGCALWDGSCDDALPAEPWWAFTAAGCVEVTTCVCEGCAGTFPTAAACAAACLE